ncbi:MAG: 50S ribosomal protein L6 [Candidatus Gastranaerophilales bacterium]|nr:50S ribosomal protein L6 [Candidatus Gastranaerophilales bacterium]
MSRIGKQPVEIPQGVEVTINGNVLTAKGPLGTETVEITSEIVLTKEDNKILVTRSSDDRKARALHGLSRTLVNNAVVGVKDGFSKKLEIQGVGYRVAKDGNALNLQLGYSHPVRVEAPAGIEFIVEGTNKITVKGPNKQAVGDVAAEIRGKRPPEVYKGKGIRYEGEYIRRKAGKAGAKKK